MKSKNAVVIVFHDTMSPRHVLMLRSLKGSGWSVSVVAWKRREASRIPADCVGMVDQWHWIPVTAPILGGLKLLTRLPAYYYYLLRNVSNLHQVDLWVLCHFSLLWCAPLLSGKKLYDVAEMYAIDMSLRLPQLGRIVRGAVSLLEGLLCSRVDGITTVDSRGAWLKRFYKRWNKNVMVIWNVPSKSDEPSQEEVDALTKEYSGFKVVAFVGGLKIKKGFYLAIEAAAAVKEAHADALFLFIGAKQNEEEAAQSLIQAHGLTGSIRLLKWMPYRRMLAHLRHAKVGLALHRREAIYSFVSAGNGRKFFSYMQAGIPIVGPNFGEIGMAVRMANCGLLVDTENVDEVSKAITELFDRPGKASRMAANGRNAFLEHFNWEKEQRKFLSLVERITNL